MSSEIFRTALELEKENAALIAALNRLIDIAEEYETNLKFEFNERKALIVKSAIERAKKLTSNPTAI
jgi:Fic family protein